MTIYLDNGKTIDIPEIEGVIDQPDIPFELSIPDEEKKLVNVFDCEKINKTEAIGRYSFSRNIEIMN